MNVVCVIEDNVLNLKLIKDILTNTSSLSLSIICFDDPIKFLERIDNNNNETRSDNDSKSGIENEEDLFYIDCFVLDIYLPNMFGLDVLKKIKQYPNYKDVPVIIQTGSDDKALRNRAFELGCADFIIKPFHFKELLNRVVYHTTQYQKLKELRIENTRLRKNLSEYIY